MCVGSYVFREGARPCEGLVTTRMLTFVWSFAGVFPHVLLEVARLCEGPVTTRVLAFVRSFASVCSHVYREVARRERLVTTRMGALVEPGRSP